MVYLFKKLKIAYIVTISVILILFIINYSYILIQNQLNYQFIIFIYILAAWISMFVFSLVANIKHNQLCMILNKDCDPVKFINAYFPLTQKYAPYKVKALTLLNLTSGYINSGDFIQAKNVLNSIDVQRINFAETVQYYNLWTVIFIDEGRIKDAENSLNYTSQYIRNKKLNKRLSHFLLEQYNTNAARINIANNHFIGAEETLNNLFNSAECQLNKVRLKYYLAMLYNKQNRNNEAVSALQYVAENGGTLYIALKARE